MIYFCFRQYAVVVIGTLVLFADNSGDVVLRLFWLTVYYCVPIFQNAISQECKLALLRFLYLYIIESVCSKVRKRDNHSSSNTTQPPPKLDLSHFNTGCKQLHPACRTCFYTLPHIICILLGPHWGWTTKTV